MSYQSTTTHTFIDENPRQPVDRRSNLSQAEFEKTYLFPNRPVIFSDGLRLWKAVRKWTPEYFKSRFSERKITIDNVNFTVAEFIDLLRHSSHENPAPYLRAQKIAEVFPELLPEIQPPFPYSQSNWGHSKAFPGWIQRFVMPEILIGGKGGRFHALHYDNCHLHAYVAQVYGRKHFYLLPPDQTPFIYPNPEIPNTSLIKNIHQPDEDRFPLFRKAKFISETLEPGEVVFVPNGWWHTTLMPEISISITWNQVNASNWTEFSTDIQAVYAEKHPALSTLFRLYGNVARLFLK